MQHRSESNGERMVRVVTEAKLIAITINTSAAFGQLQCDTEQAIAAAYARGVAEGRKAAASDFETGRRVGEHQARAQRRMGAKQIQARMAEAIGRRFDHHV
jgi:hypothetical protein